MSTDGCMQDGEANERRVRGQAAEEGEGVNDGLTV